MGTLTNWQQQPEEGLSEERAGGPLPRLHWGHQVEIPAPPTLGKRSRDHTWGVRSQRRKKRPLNRSQSVSPRPGPALEKGKVRVSWSSLLHICLQTMIRAASTLAWVLLVPARVCCAEPQRRQLGEGIQHKSLLSHSRIF